MPTQRLTVIRFFTLFKTATYFIQAKAQNFSFLLETLASWRFIWFFGFN